MYESASRELENWEEYPDGLTTSDWRAFFGRREYQRAFVDFFLDEVVRKGYDWRFVVEGYLCGGERPLVDCLVSGCECSLDIMEMMMIVLMVM